MTSDTGHISEPQPRGHRVRSLRESVALVPGGGRGIAPGYVKSWCVGARVMVDDLHDNDATRAALARLRDLGGEVRFRPGDVSVVEEVQRLVRDTVGQFGRIDLLVNNAGDARYDRPRTSPRRSGTAPLASI